ncbi:hypothetical protein [Escherichia phage BYEP01]|nr:hypothetical protein [Escherichia phage BYEP01]
MSQTSILKNAHCEKCKWPVVFALCNDEMACDFDYWCYCSNKGCINHKGEGFYSGFYPYPDFVKKVNRNE